MMDNINDKKQRLAYSRILKTKPLTQQSHTCPHVNAVAWNRSSKSVNLLTGGGISVRRCIPNVIDT